MPGINFVSFVFYSLADLTLEKATLDSGKLDLGLVSADSTGVEPEASLCTNKVSFSLLSIPCEILSFIGSNREKSSVLLTF